MPPNIGYHSRQRENIAIYCGSTQKPSLGVVMWVLYTHIGTHRPFPEAKSEITQESKSYNHLEIKLGSLPSSGRDSQLHGGNYGGKKTDKSKIAQHDLC